MEILKPKKLKNGMKIGILSVSGAIKDVNELNIAKSRLEKSGFNVVVSAVENYRNMAGTKEFCLNNLYKFFEDKSIDAIIVARGGYGTLRFLGDIDYSVIKSNPKIFVGFSDITNLLAMFYKKAGLIGFYGPMALSDFASNFDKTSYYKMLDILMDKPMTISENGKTLYIASNGGVVNIRSGNGENYPVLFKAENQAAFPFVASADNGWNAIALSDDVGWVSGKYSRV